MGKKKKAAMSIDSIISQISSLKDNSQSFITKDGDDEIWREDVRACESAIAILSALQDAGINDPKQLNGFIKHGCHSQKKKHQQIKCVVVGSWVDKKSGRDVTLDCIGAYEDYEKAYGAALLYLDEMAEGEYRDDNTDELMITTTVRLEGDTGFGLFLKDKDEKDLYRTYILDAPKAKGDDADGSY